MASLRVLLTGAAGFVGSHIADELTSQSVEVVALDSLTYAGRLDRLPSVKFVHHDFRQPLTAGVLSQIGKVDYIIHNGAESHVARSFSNPRIFVESNILGTMNLLEAARALKPEKFIYVSTDEVFGPSRVKPFLEDDRLQPTNVYAATKASGEFLAYSYFRSFGVPVVISRTMNIFGESQHPEKFVPRVVKQILNDEIVNVHGDNSIVPDVWVSGSRNWLHARVQANALFFLLRHGIPGEKYQISGKAFSNMQMVSFIAETLGKPANWRWSVSPNPVHDFSYSLNGEKIQALGWSPNFDFDESLKQTILWMAEHQEFLKD